MNGTYTESRGQLSSISFAREITISIEGDLNAEEKKEIKKILGKIFKMMKNFLSGKHGKLTVPAGKDIKLDTLANVEAKFEVTKSALEVKHASAEYVTNSSIPASESDRGTRAMDRLIKRMSKAVKDSKVEHDRLLKYFEHSPSRMSAEYVKREPDAREMRKMLRKITAGLFNQLEKITG